MEKSKEPVTRCHYCGKGIADNGQWRVIIEGKRLVDCCKDCFTKLVANRMKGVDV